MIRKKKPRSQDYNWRDLRCPSCSSINVIKLETKDHCEGCALHGVTSGVKMFDNGCERKACDNSQDWITKNSIRQRFLCQACGYKFSEVRRIL
jgi:transposase-like protein